MAKYIITGYHIVNGTRSEKKEYNKEVNTKEDIDNERKVLEEKHGCFKKTILGKERVSSINFIYKQK
jgi:uncharacterized membrane protein